MRHCSKFLLFAAFLAGTALSLPAPASSAQSPAQKPAQPLAQNSVQNKPAQTPPLSVDRDPVSSPDAGITPPSTADGGLEKQGTGYILHADVEEVVLNATVLGSGNRLVEDLKKEDFQVFEDGVKQTILSFQHTDLPVSIALVVDNSGSMAKKRPSVNKSALDLIQASNPQDEAFVVNFSDEAFIDQEFTSDVNKLNDGLSHIDSRGGTALYDAVGASADKLAADAKHPKQVLILITDGEDNASLAQSRTDDSSRTGAFRPGRLYHRAALRRRDEPFRGAPCAAGARNALVSTETGGMAFFPKSIEQVDEIAAEVARDIRSQYTIGYHSTKPTTQPGFRRVELRAEAKGEGKLNVRTRTGYFPVVRTEKKKSAAAGN